MACVPTCTVHCCTALAVATALWAPPVGIPPEGARSGGVGVERLAGVQCDDNTAEMAPQATATVEKGPPSSKKEAKIATESPGTKHDRIIRDKRSAKPAKSEKDDSKKDGETKKLSIAAAVTAYCLRMGPWIVVSACGNVQCVRGDAQVAECAVAMTGRRLVRSSALVAPAAQD